MRLFIVSDVFCNAHYYKELELGATDGADKVSPLKSAELPFFLFLFFGFILSKMFCNLLINNYINTNTIAVLFVLCFYLQFY